MKNVALEAFVRTTSYIPSGGGEMPPEMEKVSLLVSWVLWVASATLFVFFIVGIVKAAGQRNHGGQVDASAAIWPIIAAMVLGVPAFT